MFSRDGERKKKKTSIDPDDGAFLVLFIYEGTKVSILINTKMVNAEKGIPVWIGICSLECVVHNAVYDRVFFMSRPEQACLRRCGRGTRLEDVTNAEASAQLMTSL